MKAYLKQRTITELVVEIDGQTYDAEALYNCLFAVPGGTVITNKEVADMLLRHGVLEFEGSTEDHNADFAQPGPNFRSFMDNLSQVIEAYQESGKIPDVPHA